MSPTSPTSLTSLTSLTSTGTTPVVEWEFALDDAPVTLSAGAGLLAVAGAEGTVRVVGAADGESAGGLELPGGALDVALARDGRHLAVTGPAGYALWRREDGRTLVRETGAWSAVAAWADERRVAIGAGRRALVLDHGGEELWRTEPAASTVTDLAWLRGGRRLAVAAYGAVRCHERHQAAPVATYPYVGSHLALAVSPGQKWICSGNQDASIHIWRVRDGNELTMSGYRQKVSRLAFDDTGRWLAADGAPDVTVWDFGGNGPAGTAPRSLRAHRHVTALAWRPGDAGQLASGGGDGTVALWHATSGTARAQLGPAATLEATGSAVAALAWWGRDMLVAAYRDGRVRAVRLPEGAL